MALVPFVFADQSGSIPLSQLDVNFANVKAFAETAGNVTGNIQANITSLGTLTSLTVTGNVLAQTFVGNLVGNISGNITVAGSNTGVLFNDNGVANAVTGLTFNKLGNTLSVIGNIVSSSAITGNALIATSGNIGTTPNVTIFRLANNFPTTFFIGGNASNVFIANVNSTTTMAGNVSVGANISATGTVTGSNLSTAGTVSASGTITGGNVATAGTISAAGNISGGNIIGTIVGTVATTSVSAVGNVTGGNILTSGQITATGNITGGNILTSGTVSLSGNLTASGNTALSGNATAPTAANGTSTTQIATTAFVTNSITNSAIPAGVILLWSGNLVTIPSGWALCNGANGTPDLRDRFVVSAGNLYSVGATGGSANAVVVSHTHTANSTVSDPGHNHTNGIYNRLLTVSGSGTVGFTDTGTEPDVTQSGNISSSTTGITVSTTVASSGVSGANANLPPYYALAYIMKL